MLYILKISGDHDFQKLLLKFKYHLPAISYFQTKFVSNNIFILKMLKLSSTYILEMTL